MENQWEGIGVQSPVWIRGSGRGCDGERGRELGDCDGEVSLHGSFYIRVSIVSHAFGVVLPLIISSLFFFGDDVLARLLASCQVQND